MNNNGKECHDIAKNSLINVARFFLTLMFF